MTAGARMIPLLFSFQIIRYVVGPADFVAVVESMFLRLSILKPIDANQPDVLSLVFRHSAARRIHRMHDDPVETVFLQDDSVSVIIENVVDRGMIDDIVIVPVKFFLAFDVFHQDPLLQFFSDRLFLFFVQHDLFQVRVADGQVAG